MLPILSNEDQINTEITNIKLLLTETVKLKHKAVYRYNKKLTNGFGFISKNLIELKKDCDYYDEIYKVVHRYYMGLFVQLEQIRTENNPEN